MAKSTLSWVLSVIASRLQQLYLNDLQRLWFKGFGFKVSGLFFLWEEKWTGLFKLNAFQRYSHRSFHLPFSLFPIFLKITAVTQVQSLFDHFSSSDNAGLWTARHVVWKSYLLQWAAEEMEHSNWQSFPQISNPLQNYLQQVSRGLINCYLLRTSNHERNGCCICRRDTCSKTDVWIHSKTEPEERLLSSDYQKRRTTISSSFFNKTAKEEARWKYT